MASELGRMTFRLCMLYFMVGSTWGMESVTINNRLPVNLKVFCHSYEDNLAVQLMTPSSVYIFHFRQNLLGDTLFTCDFTATGYGYAGIKVWEGFNYAHRKCPCTQCRWDVTMGGFGCNGRFISELCSDALISPLQNSGPGYTGLLNGSHSSNVAPLLIMFPSCFFNF